MRRTLYNGTIMADLLLQQWRLRHDGVEDAEVRIEQNGVPAISEYTTGVRIPPRYVQTSQTTAAIANLLLSALRLRIMSNPVCKVYPSPSIMKRDCKMAIILLVISTICRAEIYPGIIFLNQHKTLKWNGKLTNGIYQYGFRTGSRLNCIRIQDKPLLNIFIYN